MSGLEKKALAQEVFEGLLDYSPLSEAEQQMAKYAFDGIVEVIIWAKHGGLKIAKDKCSLICGKSKCCAK